MAELIPARADRMSKVREPDDADKDQVYRYDVIQEPGDHQDQDACDQGDNRLQENNAHSHLLCWDKDRDLHSVQLV
jgi:hypothetical protein